MVGVLVKRMLPPALPDYSNKSLFTGMHMGISVVGLMRIFRRIIGVHVVRHRSPVNYEVSGVIGLCGNHEMAPWRCNSASACGRPRWVDNLRQRLTVNVGIHLGELEQILSVVATAGNVVGSAGRRKAEIGFGVEVQGRWASSDVEAGVSIVRRAGRN